MFCAPPPFWPCSVGLFWSLALEAASICELLTGPEVCANAATAGQASNAATRIKRFMNFLLDDLGRHRRPENPHRYCLAAALMAAIRKAGVDRIVPSGDALSSTAGEK